jgi:hypothetical protein
MQFEMISTFLGCSRVNVDGRIFCSVFTGQEPVGDNTANTRGYEVTKIGADPEVFDQLHDVKAGDQIKFVALLKKAAGGKSQPYFVGVVSDQKAASPSSASGASTKAAADK